MVPHLILPLEQLWLLISIVQQPGYWPTHSGDCIVDDGGAALDPGLRAGSLFGVEGEVVAGRPHAGGWTAFKVATLNVQSLQTQSDQIHDDFLGRVAYLRAQFENLGISIVAFEETRSKKDEAISSQNFVRLCSQRDRNGSLGVELWFAQKSWAGLSGFRPEDLTVVYWDPRTLCVRVKSERLKATVVNIHAPTAQDPDRDSWWHSLRQLLKRICSGQEVMILGDLNTRMKHTIVGRIGEFVRDTKLPSSLCRRPWCNSFMSRTSGRRPHFLVSMWGPMRHGLPPGAPLQPGFLTTYSRLARGVYLKEARAWLLRLTQDIDPLTILPLLSAFGFPSRRRLPKDSEPGVLTDGRC